MSALLTVTGLTLYYAGQRVLHNVAITLQPGEILGLVGESGSGKSSLGMAVLGLLPPIACVDGGQIDFQGSNLLSLDARARRALCGRKIGLIPQEPMTSLNPTLRIGRQIDLILHHHRCGDPATRRSLAHEALAQVQIADPERILRSYPFELSGGQLQRVLIAIAFALRPALVIADEPTTALDATVQAAVLELLVERACSEGTGVLLISHNIGMVRRYADRVAVMRRGEIVETGPARAVLDRPQHPYTTALMAALPGRAIPRTPLPVPAPEPGR